MFRRFAALLLAFGLGLTALAAVGPVPLAAQAARAPVWPVSGEDITRDPGFVFGELPNGVRYILRRNSTPEGTALVRMHIASGSLEEREHERGLAHFLEHMAFNGSRGIPEGDMIKLLEREGLAFGADTNASTGFEAITYMLNLPRNTPGGPVSGYEIGVQLPFFWMDGFWSNFGVVGNYTRVNSDIDYVNSTGAVVLSGPLVGLSEESYNATVYYEDETFSVRVSAAYRSDYPTTLPGRNGNATEDTAATLNYDASARWNLNENFALTFEGVNLTDEANDQYLTPDNRSSFYHHYGRSYFLGARYTY